jgi:hypothetical protein
MTDEEIIEVLYNMKTDLLKRVEILGATLPPNTLDELIDQLGGPSCVAEVKDNDAMPLNDAFSFR